MRGHNAAKITISLPRNLVEYADKLAQERSTTRSGVIAELLSKEEQARIHALMEEGYREMAEENRCLAEEALPLISESILWNTRWDETPGA